MATETYEVIADEYTVHKQIGELTDPITGTVTGVQQGSGKVYLKGDVLSAADVSPLIVEALEDEDNPNHDYVSKRLVKSSEKAALNLEARLGGPFAGYDDMDEDEVLAALRNLPSATISAVKQYEIANEGRARIVNYSVGFGESPVDRQEGRVGSQLDEDGAGDAEKAVSELTTREVPEEGIVQVGDGITGTGDPQIPHGSQKDDDDDKPAARRRSRRTRPAATKPKPEGSGEDGE